MHGAAISSVTMVKTLTEKAFYHSSYCLDFVIIGAIAEVLLDLD